MVVRESSSFVLIMNETVYGKQRRDKMWNMTISGAVQCSSFMTSAREGQELWTDPKLDM